MDINSVYFLGKTNLQINENEFKDVYFAMINNDQKTECINHHILLVDVSLSMTQHIDKLKARLIITLSALVEIPNNYVSVITYSSHQESKRIINAVKCDSMSYNMSQIYNTIESELHTKSMTIMSEPLQQSITIVKSLIGICNKHHIALFTDGCVTPSLWSEQQEKNKCFEIADLCKKENIFLNAIGFGQYYDRKFLKALTERAGSGFVIHIDHIEDYSNTILQIIQKVNAVDSNNITISTDNNNIFNFSNSMFCNSMNANHNDMFCIIDTNKVMFNNSIIYNFDDCKILKDHSILDDFYYALARYYLKKEDMDNYEFILKILGDVYLYHETINCHSFIEKGNAINTITKLIEHKNLRYSDGKYTIKDDIITEPLCILEVLQSISSDNDSELYWDTSMQYHRITQKTHAIEEDVIFQKDTSRLIPISNMNISSNKLNIGISVKINGYVENKTTSEYKDAYIVRNYNIVNNGNINIPYIYAKLSNDLIYKFDQEHILIIDDELVENSIYKINLQKLKSANKRILKSMKAIEIIKSLKEIAELKCNQWSLKQIIKQITDISNYNKLELSNLSEEEIEIRKRCNIDEHGMYHPSSVTKDVDAPFEIYPAQFITWSVKFPDKHHKEICLKKYQTLINNIKLVSYTDDQILLMILNLYLQKVKKNIQDKEFKINCVRMASGIINKTPFIWDVSLEKTKTVNDKILNKNMVVDGKVNVFKKVVNEEIIEEKRWKQYIICN